MHPITPLFLFLLTTATPALARFARADSPSWKPPQETATAATPVDPFGDAIGILHGQAPEPTSAPRFAAEELVARLDGYTMGTNTCGFVTSSWSEPIVCVSSGYQCTNIGNYRGCCNDPSCSAIKTRCLDYSASVRGACTASDYHTVCCSMATAPYCFTYMFSTKGSTYSALACDTYSGAGTLLDYPPIYTASDDSTDNVSATIASLTLTSAHSSTTRSVANATTTSSSSSSSSSKTPTGAIIGGVVGGLGGLAAIAAALFFFLRHSKKKSTATPGIPHPTQSTMSSYPPTSPSTTYTPSGGPGCVYPAGYAPPGQPPYAEPVKDAYGNTYVNGQLVAQGTPSPVSPPGGISGVPVGGQGVPGHAGNPVELGTVYQMGSQGNRAELY